VIGIDGPREVAMAIASEDFKPQTATAPMLRAIYRSGAGEVRFDWPAERIGDALGDEGGTLWVDIRGEASHAAAVEALFRDVFGFHPLAIDDALRETHVPKVDDWEKYLYTVFHALDFDPKAADEGLHLHEVDLFLGPNYLVTYHTDPIAAIDKVRRFLERESGNRLKRGADHLLYLLLDQGVADYMTAIEQLDEAIDDAQDEVFAAPTRATLQKIFRIKRAALRMYRVIAPQREVLNRLARDHYDQIDAPDRVYFRDVYDHLVRLHDITESLRDLIAGALDTYLSAIANRTNEVMKTLTLVTVMFLPMSFLAGFFGMNFFGETLAFRSALPKDALFWSTCLVMAATPVGMWGWARWRGWF